MSAPVSPAAAEGLPPVQEQMADAIVLLMQQRGYCRARDLEAKGFRPEDIGHFWAHANALAAVQLMPNNHNNNWEAFDDSGRRYN
jgi:hypothetical protein